MTLRMETKNIFYGLWSSERPPASVIFKYISGFNVLKLFCFTIGYKTPYLLSLEKYLLREKKFEDSAPKCFFDHTIVTLSTNLRAWTVNKESTKM